MFKHHMYPSNASSMADTWQAVSPACNENLMHLQAAAYQAQVDTQPLTRKGNNVLQGQIAVSQCNQSSV